MRGSSMFAPASPGRPGSERRPGIGGSTSASSIVALARQDLVEPGVCARAMPEPDRRVRLRIDVHQQRLVARLCDARRDVHRGRRLAHPALLVGDRVNRAHRACTLAPTRSSRRVGARSRSMRARPVSRRCGSAAQRPLTRNPGSPRESCRASRHLLEDVQMAVSAPGNGLDTGGSPPGCSPSCHAARCRRLLLAAVAPPAPVDQRAAQLAAAAPRTRAPPAAARARARRPDVAAPQALTPLLGARAHDARVRRPPARRTPRRNCALARPGSRPARRRCAGSAIASAQPGKASAGAEVGDLPRRADAVELERHQRVGECTLHRLLRRAHRRRGVLVRSPARRSERRAAASRWRCAQTVTWQPARGPPSRSVAALGVSAGRG